MVGYFLQQFMIRDYAHAQDACYLRRPSTSSAFGVTSLPDWHRLEDIFASLCMLLARPFMSLVRRWRAPSLSVSWSLHRLSPHWQVHTIHDIGPGILTASCGLECIHRTTLATWVFYLSNPGRRPIAWIWIGSAEVHSQTPALHYLRISTRIHWRF